MFKILSDLLDQEGFNERPGQMILIDKKEDGSLYHLPKKPYRMYFGLEDGALSISYESAVILLTNFSDEDLQVEVIKGLDAHGAIEVKLGGDAILPRWSAEKPGHCRITFDANPGAIESALETHRSRGVAGDMMVYRRFYLTYDLRLNDMNGQLRHRIDPELIFEGRP